MLRASLFFGKLTLWTAITAAYLQAATLEVLHSWTSPGESQAVAILKNILEEKGHTWQDSTVATGGANAAEALKKRILQGNPPAAAMMKKFDLQRWQRLGFLENINDTASANNWDQQLHKPAREAIQHKGVYVAAAVGIHRTNWMWASKPVLDRAGVSMPTTWPEFFAAAEKIRSAGFPVIALGDEPYQLGTLFESLILSVGGVDFYNSVITRLDYGEMKGPTMIETFELARRIQPYLYFDEDTNWLRAAQLIANNEAAFTFVGDWIKGEFNASGKRPMIDYICAPVINTENKFIFNVDSVALIKVKNSTITAAQADLADAIMSEDFQLTYNRQKGSIPARSDLLLNGYDQCALMGQREMTIAAQSGAQVPSMSHGLAQSELISEAFDQVVSEFFHDTNITPEQAGKMLSRELRKGTYSY